MEQKTLAAKLAKIMGELERVPKTGKNKFQNYKFAEANAVYDAVSAKLSEYNVAFLSSILDIKTDIAQDNKGSAKYITYVFMEFTFICGDTGQVMANRWVGEAHDSGDKGVNKASTAALKYFLLKTFMLSTGDPDDDPDYDNHLNSQTQAPAKNGSSKTTQKSPPTLANEPHWTKSPDKFLAFANSTFGFNEGQVINALDQAYGVPGTGEINQIADFTGDKYQAMAALICEFAKWDRTMLVDAKDTYAKARGIVEADVKAVQPHIVDVMERGATQQELITDSPNPYDEKHLEF